MPELAFPPLDGNKLGKNFQQCGFARPIGTDEGDAFLLFDLETQIRIDNMIPISLPNLTEGSYPLTASGGLGKGEGNGGIGFLGRIDSFHAL